MTGRLPGSSSKPLSKVSSRHSPSPDYFNQYFVDFLSRHCGEIAPELQQIIMQLCQVTRLQQSCLDLAEVPESTIKQLSALPFVGTPAEDEPLLLVDKKLFLHRYYHLERQVGARITALNQPLPGHAAGLVSDLLDAQFTHPATPGTEPDRQRLAAQLVVSRQLAIITGGPGTGKTTLIIKLLGIILALQPELNIHLAALTGKAAARLAETLRQQDTDERSTDERIRALAVTTLHRLLGFRKDGHSWRHGPDNPIKTDLLIVDEVSMIDMTLMHNLLSALPQGARLVLIGDPHQLPPVGMGNTLADLCRAGETKLADAICQLETNYRFKKDSPIGQLASGIKSGNAAFRSSDEGSVSCLPSEEISRENCGSLLLGTWQEYVALLMAEETNPELLLSSFDRARILCGNRLGFPGVVMINRLIEQELEKRGLKIQGQAYYPGRPVMVTENNYNLNLFNGDTGICVLMDSLEGPQEDSLLQQTAEGSLQQTAEGSLQQTAEGSLQQTAEGSLQQTAEGSYKKPQEMVAFPDIDPDTERQVKYLPVSRLPAHETCFAMSVHKSQGSEFEHTTLVLSDQPSSESGLFTKELLYTAVTRARESIIIYGSEALWDRMLRQTALRASDIFLDG